MVLTPAALAEGSGQIVPKKITFNAFQSQVKRINVSTDTLQLEP
jgi:hypothetical protein